MTDPFESVLAESLHARAAHADTRGRGFGEVRRRVRRHRQRQLAAGLLPAAAGFGWFITRPVADDPLRPGGDAAAGCGDTVPAPTGPGLAGDATSTTMTFDSNGDPVGVFSTSTTYPLSTLPATTVAYVIDANGNVVVTAVYDPQRDGTTTTTFGQEAASSMTPTTSLGFANSTVQAEVATTSTDCVSPASPSTIALGDFSRVLVVNASEVGGAEQTVIGSFFPAAAAANSGVQWEESFAVLLRPDDAVAASLFKFVAAQIGVDGKTMDPTQAAEELGLTGVDLSAYDVVLVVGNRFALSFAGSPTTSTSVVFDASTTVPYASTTTSIG